jgi:hypothetical protein
MPDNQTTFFGLPKLPARYASLVLPFFLTCVMTCVRVGYQHPARGRYRAWGTGYLAGVVGYVMGCCLSDHVVGFARGSKDWLRRWFDSD